MRFWDASAILPLCLQEPSSPLFKKILQEDEAIAAWWATPVECDSAFARLRRGGSITETEEEKARQILSVLSGAWTEVQPSQTLRNMASRSLRLHPLHSADSLQLAAALIWVQGQPGGKDFVCADKRLCEAARREGFRTLPLEISH